MKLFNTLKDMSFKNKKIIIRVDFNLPLDEKGFVTDDFRVKKALPTINYILEKNPLQIILMSHLGKPKGVFVDRLKMDNVALTLLKNGLKVKKLDDCIDLDIPNDKIILLENLRFHPEEKANDSEFAKKLASYADIYVNDAFGTCHRAHASVSEITKYLPSCAGLLVEKEIEMLDLQNPARPFVAILGAAKIGDKIEMVEKLLEKVDYLLLGGAIVFNFLKAKGLEIGQSLHEDEHIDTAKRLLTNPKIIIPRDIIIASEIKIGAKHETVRCEEIPSNAIGLDIGEKTVEYYKEILSNAKTVFWNGPVGMFEVPPFDKGSRELAEFIITLDAKTIVGGGDTVNAVRIFNIDDKFSHVSTGGGASIEMIEGKELPGITALIQSNITF